MTNLLRKHIFVGMSDYTAGLHWVAFGFCATLPGLENRTRLRMLDVQKDYEWVMANGSPYTVAHPSDRLALIDLQALGAAVPAHLEAFLSERARPGNW